ncbi:sensor histidine kinase [Amycolatopsis jejuensis]|uniref:sensor histidine kinase n=1 Tax=Amycolatopsis jejuensis TaxID=330084 RepID=UPI00052666C9|nr:HAMP domain-containing sensor histidine kinase [Amycolatopsis jejuensis]
MKRTLFLRWRVSAAFALGLVLVVSALSVATWHLTTGYMFSQREQSADRQSQVNVRLVDNAIRNRSDGLDELLTGLATNPDSTILVSLPGGWRTAGRQVRPETLPPALLTPARTGTAAPQRFTSGGIPVVAVAVPLTAAPGLYVELHPLLELEQTFRYLRVILIAGTLVCGLFGIVLGAWSVRRALRPLAAFTDAAGRIARGDLRARLPEQADPELAPLATTFNATAAALEQRVRRDARFAADVSHELRSPLTTMTTVAEVLDRRRDAMPAPAQKALHLLLAELRRFRRMVLDLLEIAAVDETDTGENRELVDLGPLARNGVASNPPLALDLAAGPLLVSGDRRRLDRILANLLDNAARYAGGAVRLGVQARDGVIRLEVDDAGAGVPAELRERIFERFARGVHAGRRDPGSGTGLGLAIVADHVHRHDGRVWVEDRPGGGARFIVELPEAGG